ncbi:MAG: twin-arginine translocation signal domain-containing protein, partial [Bacteroidales bacterium]|nr:twin-arginine translocation signal domain-containing protein [Bacteroidales bacterium]
MKNSRRDFIKLGGVSIAATGIVPSFLASCAGPDDETKSGTGLTIMIEGVEPLTEEDYKRRQVELVSALDKSGMEAIFIEGSTNLRYFFNISWWLS